MSIEVEVERAAESVLGAAARCGERLAHGDINRVFKVAAAGRAFVLKVFSQPEWPEAGKLPWVESQLARRGVARAKLIHYTRGAEFFPHGFSLSEYLPGANCKQLVREGRLSAFEYLELIGALLRPVHEIEVPRYGYLGAGRGTEDDYAGWVLGWELKECADKLAGAPGAGQELSARAAGRVEKILRRFEGRFRPALLHADATPKNAILNDAGRVALVDWDEAVSGPWLWDYTNLSYWYSYILHRGGIEVRDKAEVRAAFFRGYGPPEFAEWELDAIEGAMQTVRALGVLAFFFQRGDAEGFARTRGLLSRLLDPATTEGRT